MRLVALAAFLVVIAGCGGSDGGTGIGASKSDFTGKNDDAVAQRLCTQAGKPADCDVCELEGWYGDGVCDVFCAQPDTDCVSPDAGPDAEADSGEPAGPSICEQVADAHVACGSDLGQRDKDVAACENNAACTEGLAAPGWDDKSRACQVSAPCKGSFPYGEECLVNLVDSEVASASGDAADFLAWCKTAPLGCAATWVPTCEGMAVSFNSEILAEIKSVCGAPTQPRACGDMRACMQFALKIQVTSRLPSNTCAGIGDSMMAAANSYAFYKTQH